MYARIVTMPLQPGAEEEMSRVLGERGPSASAVSQGYRGGYVLVDRGAHTGGTLTLWDTREQADAFTQSSQRQGIMAALSSLVAGEPKIEIYEVAVEVPATQH